jgi:hypothetical protein
MKLTWTLTDSIGLALTVLWVVGSFWLINRC